MKCLKANKNELNIEIIDNQYIRPLFKLPVPRKILTLKNEEENDELNFDTLNPSSSMIDRQFTVMCYNILAENFAKHNESWTYIIFLLHAYFFF